jgi:hypothetical protein
MTHDDTSGPDPVTQPAPEPAPQSAGAVAPTPAPAPNAAPVGPVVPNAAPVAPAVPDVAPVADVAPAPVMPAPAPAAPVVPDAAPAQSGDPDGSLPHAQPDTDAPDTDAPPSEAPLMWAPVEPPRRRRRWPWIVAVLVLLAIAATAGGLWLAGEAKERADAARAVSADEQEVIAAAIEVLAPTDAQISAQRDAYQTDAAEWDADEAATAQWQATADAPPAVVGNPGGSAMPGADPTGRAFLDSIGATDVQVMFDAGPDNCGYSSAGSEGWTYTAGGCYDTRFRNWLFLAWDRGGEDLVWPVFVHEAMHWYQYQQYYALFLAADRAGIAHEAYGASVESDASCRAVYVHGIDAEEYEDSSSPCDVDGWYEGWLRDKLVGLGARAAEPTPAEYEVSEVIRP